MITESVTHGEIYPVSQEPQTIRLEGREPGFGAPSHPPSVAPAALSNDRRPEQHARFLGHTGPGGWSLWRCKGVKTNRGSSERRQPPLTQLNPASPQAETPPRARPVQSRSYPLWILWCSWGSSRAMLLQARVLLSSVRSSKDSSPGETTLNCNSVSQLSF